MNEKPAAPGRGEIHIREAGSADLGRIITRHAELYGREQGFGDDFALYVLKGLAEYADKDPSRSRVWIAEADGVWAGSMGVVEASPERAQLRWLLVEPEARGLGLGKKLFLHALEFCREHGYSEAFLWTVDALKPARAMYAALGFSLAETKQGEMGGVPVTEELWRLELD
jgi:GNAT superfamily N-acetyltransferase